MTANSTIFMGLWFGISQVSKSGDCLIKKKQFLRGACAAKGSSDCSWTGLYIYLLHESEWNMARYFTSRRPYFHEPQEPESEMSRIFHSDECDKLFILCLISSL